MTIETTGSGILILIILMAMVTLTTRWGGVLIMSFVPINYRVQQFIKAMSGSVLVALLAPLALTGDVGARLALLTTAILMLVMKKPLVSIAGGIACAALVRQIQ